VYWVKRPRGEEVAVESQGKKVPEMPASADAAAQATSAPPSVRLVGKVAEVTKTSFALAHTLLKQTERESGAQPALSAQVLVQAEENPVQRLGAQASEFAGAKPSAGQASPVPVQNS
jgi:hypothetical protein